MKNWLSPIGVFVSLIVTLGTPLCASAKLTVAATVPDLAAIVKEVAGDKAEVFSLTLPTQDPHFVDARPHLALKLSKADLLVMVGLELEVGWLPVLLTGARNPKIQNGTPGYLDCSTVVMLKEVPQVKVDRSQGDIHPGGNPHYLVGPENALRVAQAVAARLAQIDPGHGGEYQANARRFGEALAKAKTRWKAAFKPYQGVPVVAYHKSWVYLTDTLGLVIAEHLEPKPGIPPSAAHVLKVMQLMRSQRIRVLLQEEYYPDRTAKLVAEKTGARLVILPGGTRVRDGQTYLQRMEETVSRILAALTQAKG